MNASRSLSRPFRIVEAASAAARLEAAASFLRQFPADQPITIVGATRGAADDLARTIAVERGATIGLARFSLTQIAARVAVTRLAGEGIAAATPLGAEAIAARAAFDARTSASLTYLAGVAGMPGFPRALANTIGRIACGRHSRLTQFEHQVTRARIWRFCLRAWTRNSSTPLRPIARGSSRPRPSPSPDSRGSSRRCCCSTMRRSIPFRRRIAFIEALCGVATTILRGPLPSHDPRTHAERLEARRPRHRASGSAEPIASWAPSNFARASFFALMTHFAAAPGSDSTLRFFLGAGRGTRGGRDRAADARGSARRRAVRRDGDPRARAAAVSRSLRARSPSCRHPRLVRPRNAATGSGRARIPRAACMRRRRTFGSPLRRIPLARSDSRAGITDGIGCHRVRRRAPRRFLPPLPPPMGAPHRQLVRHRRQSGPMVRAGSSTVSAAEFALSACEEVRRDDPESARQRSLSSMRDLARLGGSSRFRAAAHHADGRVAVSPRHGAVVASASWRRSRRACCTRRRTCCASSRICGKPMATVVPGRRAG